jgi:hypothetical protein
LFFDREWTLLEFTAQYPKGTGYEKPAGFIEMMTIAEALASEFRFARVDLYDVGGRIVFGEITHFPDSGNSRFKPRAYDEWAGKFFV